MNLSLISHFFNEELLLADFIDYHKKIFDYGILINHHSTDKSAEIAEKHMPKHWRLVNSKLLDFNAWNNDLEVMKYEQELPTGYKLILNTTEYLFTPNIKEKLAVLENENPTALAFGMRTVCLVDKEPEIPVESPIWRNRTNGFINFDTEGLDIRRDRYIHKANHGNYEVGRHGTSLSYISSRDLFVLHLSYSPWPSCINRKLQIQTRIPDYDKKMGWGFEHMVDLDGLNKARENHLRLSYDLMSKPIYKQYYNELLKLYYE